MTYIFETRVAVFASARDWCQELGGELPSIHSKDDIDFLLESMTELWGSKHSIWIGLKTSSINKCDKWTDGSSFDYVIGGDQDRLQTKCSSCKDSCALRLDQDGYFNFSPCDGEFAKQVCVIPAF